MTYEMVVDLNNPPNFNQSVLFSIDALVGIEVQGTGVNFYNIINQLPFENYSKGGILVIW